VKVLGDFAHAVTPDSAGIAREVTKKFNRRAGAMPTLRDHFRFEIG
jgi:hypothetical protein